MKQTVGVIFILKPKNWQDKSCNVDIDVGLHCTAEANSPPPSRLLTEEAEEDEEEETCFIVGLRIYKIEVLAGERSRVDVDDDVMTWHITELIWLLLLTISLEFVCFLVNIIL